MALIHKALAVQQKERAKLAEEQAKLAVVEARLDKLASVMEKMQLVQLALCRGFGASAVKTFYSEADGRHIDILLPHIYTAKLVHPNGQDVAIMSVNGEVIEPVSDKVQNVIDAYYLELLKGNEEA